LASRGQDFQIESKKNNKETQNAIKAIHRQHHQSLYPRLEFKKAVRDWSYRHLLNQH